MSIPAAPHRSTSARARIDVNADLDDDRRLAHLPGVRLALVLWGGLLLTDLSRMAGTPAYVALAALAVLVAASSVGMGTGTAVLAGVVGALLANGFVVHRLGVLRYDGAGDLARLTLLVVVAVTAARLHR